jgi:hypothetical protein
MARPKKETTETKKKTVKVPKKEKPVKQQNGIPSPFDILKNMFLQNGEFEKYNQNPLIFNRNLFMINRTCSIMYPLQAQYFNILGISASDVILSWRLFLTKMHGMGRTPGFIYTKGAKATVKEQEKKSTLPVYSQDIINSYCNFYHYSLKDYQDMLEFCPDILYKNLDEYIQIVINSNELITKTKI